MALPVKRTGRESSGTRHFRPTPIPRTGILTRNRIDRYHAIAVIATTGEDHEMHPRRLPKPLRRMGAIVLCTGCQHTDLSHTGRFGACKVPGCKCVVLHGEYPTE